MASTSSSIVPRCLLRSSNSSSWFDVIDFVPPRALLWSLSLAITWFWKVL